MSWQVQAGGRLGALGTLVTLYLSILLAVGQAPYDWAWSRGQHATPAQWRAHERAEEGGRGHHGVAAAKHATWRSPHPGPLPRGEGAVVRSPHLGGEGAVTADGLWLVDGAHDLHPAVADGYMADGAPSLTIAPPALWRRITAPWIGAAPGPPPQPAIQPPRPTGAR